MYVYDSTDYGGWIGRSLYEYYIVAYHFYLSTSMNQTPIYGLFFNHRREGRLDEWSKYYFSTTSARKGPRYGLLQFRFHVIDAEIERDSLDDGVKYRIPRTAFKPCQKFLSQSFKVS